MSPELAKAVEIILASLGIKSDYTGQVELEIHLKGGQVKDIYQKSGRRKVFGHKVN